MKFVFGLTLLLASPAYADHYIAYQQYIFRDRSGVVVGIPTEKFTFQVGFHVSATEKEITDEYARKSKEYTLFTDALFIHRKYDKWKFVRLELGAGIGFRVTLKITLENYDILLQQITYPQDIEGVPRPYITTYMGVSFWHIHVQLQYKLTWDEHDMAVAVGVRF